MRKPFRLVLIGGPNGAGKTTFAREYVARSSKEFTFLNADEIAREPDVASLEPGRRDIAAGRRLLRRLEALIDDRRDIVIETTLSGHGYAERIPAWREADYLVKLYYLRLPSADAAVERVARRVAAGGHSVPETVIRRRFDRSLVMLRDVFSDLVDEVRVYDWNGSEYQLSEERTKP